MQHEHPPHSPHPRPDSPGTSQVTAPRPPKQEQERATTDVTEVAPGVLRTQLPIEMPGLGHVNCYVMEDARGIAVVDPGLPGDEPWDGLVDRLRRAGYRVADVHTVIVTHSHPDHFGGALRLRAEADAEIVTHASFRTLFDRVDVSDSEDSADLDLNTAEGRLAAIERYFDAPTPWGSRRQPPSGEFLERIQTMGPIDPLRPTRPLDDGQTIHLARREWVAMHTPGHTHDHLCLYDPEYGVVFTGDHVLPSITPHIGGMAAGPDPLQAFFDSLTRMSEMADVTMALPAHGHPFADLRGRAEHIIEHHQERLDVIRRASTEVVDGTVNQYMRVLFRERSWGEMAESETFAHLEHLRGLGELVRSDDGGVARYRPSQAA